MSKAKGHSLWLKPEGKIYDELNSIILDLSKKYQTPLFEAHITLLPEILGGQKQVIEKSEELAKKTNSFEIRLGQVDHLDLFFRCLFFRIAESKELKRLNEETKKVFNRNDDETYMPHLSLIYGSFPEKEKKQMLQEMEGKLKALEGEKLRFQTLDLYSTNGEVADWGCVKSFAMN